MRKLSIVLVTVGALLTQAAFASGQCNLEPGNEINCSGCSTLNDFAFYGASALYSAGQQRSILVNGNGSRVSVSKYTAWNQADLSVSLGKLGEFGFNLPYPSFREAQVTAYDITHRLKGSLPNGGRYPYSALKAKCDQIEKEKAAKDKEEVVDAGGGVSRGMEYYSDIGRRAYEKSRYPWGSDYQSWLNARFTSNVRMFNCYATNGGGGTICFPH